MVSLCFTKDEDARLERGWPHCVVFVDGHSHDARPVPSATAVVGNIDARYRTEWPREVAYRFLRAGCITQFRKSNFEGSKLTKATRAILETPGPMSKDEAKRALADAVRSGLRPRVRGVAPQVGDEVRLVKIGGLSLMNGLLARKFPAPALPSVLRDFGMIRAPETAELALSLVGTSSVKDAPLKWLVAHADLARPIVEAAAKRGAKSAVAKTVLKQLPRS